MEIKNCKDIQLNTITALICGESGAGKTTLLSTLPPKTIIVSMESGLLTLRGRDVDYVEITGEKKCPERGILDPVVAKIESLRAVLGSIAESDYDNVCIDSLTELAEVFVEYAKREYPDDKQVLKMFGYYNTLMTNMIKYTRDMNKNVFFTSLLKTEKDDQGRRYYLPSVAGSVAEKGLAHFDFVFNLLVFERDGEKVRALLTDSRDGYRCKDRSGMLSEFEKPDLGQIINKLKGERNV